MTSGLKKSTQVVLGILCIASSIHIQAISFAEDQSKNDVGKPVRDSA